MPFRSYIALVLSATLALFACSSPPRAPAANAADRQTSVTPDVHTDLVRLQSPAFAPVRIRDDLFVWTLNNATVHPLDTLPGGKAQWLYLRLYALPAEGTCVEGTHFVCAFRYLLGVAPDGEGPQAAYDLGLAGQITRIEWLPRDNADIDHARLRVDVLNYPTWALESNPALPKISKRFELFVGVDTLVVRGLP